MLRANFLLGPMFRGREVDAVLAAGLEYGRMHGVSGALHGAFTPPHPRQFFDTRQVIVRESALGAGPILRGRPRRVDWPVYGSVGLTVGIRIHHADTGTGVVRRVDPDFRVPIQLAWTMANVGLSFALVQGYSIRTREYESRGVVQWGRSAYRIGLMFGLHWDMIVGPARTGGARATAASGKRRRR
jgi:hypothetical protein